MRALPTALLFLHLVPCAACNAGQLGNAAASELCAPEDANCTTRRIPPLAAGARATLQVDALLPTGGEEPATHLLFVDEDVAREQDGLVQAVGPGTTAVLFMTTDGRVLDFTHVAVATPRRLVVAAGAGEDVDARGIEAPLPIAAGASAPVTLVPRSDSQALSGALDARVLSGDARVRVRDDGHNAFTVAVDPDTPSGDVPITFEAIGLTAQITVRVGPPGAQQEQP